MKEIINIEIKDSTKTNFTLKEFLSELTEKYTIILFFTLLVICCGALLCFKYTKTMNKTKTWRAQTVIYPALSANAKVLSKKDILSVTSPDYNTKYELTNLIFNHFIIKLESLNIAHKYGVKNTNFTPIKIKLENKKKSFYTLSVNDSTQSGATNKLKNSISYVEAQLLGSVGQVKIFNMAFPIKAVITKQSLTLKKIFIISFLFSLFFTLAYAILKSDDLMR